MGPVSASAISHYPVSDSVSARPSSDGPSDTPVGASSPARVPKPSPRSSVARLEERFDCILANYAKQIRDREVIESQTQAKKRVRVEETRKREAKRRIRAAAKYGGRGN
jgi:hypothetical protein